MSSPISLDKTSPPSEALMELLSPDGYYKYLGISKKLSPTGDAGDLLDQDLVKKNYRKLSLKHHPDKRGGDSETFRVLNRAQKVLQHPKLRQQYDILGLDLDDDDADVADNGVQGSEVDPNAQSTTQGIVHEVASMALTGVLQLGVKTMMMGAASVIVVRYRLLLAPALAFLGFVAYRIYTVAKVTGGANGTSSYDMLSPFLIANGLLLMHQSAYNRESPSFWTYWLGESLVIGMFVVNSMNWASMFGQPRLMYAAIATFSILTALWFRGKFWNYFLVIALELFLAIFIALAFPVMEMVLEAILNDKLRKVGDKLRHHHLRMEEYYNSKR